MFSSPFTCCDARQQLYFSSVLASFLATFSCARWVPPAFDAIFAVWFSQPIADVLSPMASMHA